MGARFAVLDFKNVIKVFCTWPTNKDTKIWFNCMQNVESERLTFQSSRYHSRTLTVFHIMSHMTCYCWDISHPLRLEEHILWLIDTNQFYGGEYHPYLLNSYMKKYFDEIMLSKWQGPGQLCHHIHKFSPCLSYKMFKRVHTTKNFQQKLTTSWLISHACEWRAQGTTIYLPTCSSTSTQPLSKVEFEETNQLTWPLEV